MEWKNSADRYSNVSKSLLAQAIDFLPDPTFAIDLRGRVLVWNRAMEAITQIKAVDIVGRGDHEYALPFYGEKRPILIDMVLQDDADLGKKYSSIRRDGDSIYAEAVALPSRRSLWGKASPIYDDDGQIIGAIESIRDITDCKRPEEVLRESEEKYRVLVENANEMILVAQDGMLKFANRKAEQILARSKEEIMAVPFVNFIHPDDRDWVFSAHLRRLKGEILPEVYSFRIIDGKGTTKWVEINAVLISWEGRPATLNFYTDITETRLAEEKYQTVFEQAAEAIFKISPSGRLLDANPALARILGYDSPEEIIDCVTDIGAQFYADPAQRKKVLDILAEKGVINNYEARYKRKDGKLIWVSLNARAVRSDDGAPLYHQGSFVDITEKKQAEEALKESEQELSQIIDFLPDATFVIDLEGKVIAWNRAMEEMTGIKSESIVGKGDHAHALAFYGIRRSMLIDLFFKPDEEIIGKYLFVKKNGDIILAEGAVPVKGGENRILSGKARPLYDSKGTIVGAIESIRDITDQRTAQSERKKLEAQLYQAQKMESLGTLAGGIAHDFNNILSPIIGFTELIMDDFPKKSTTHDHLSEILTAASRASDLVSQILTFSRKTDTAYSPVALNIILKESLKMLRSVIPSTIEIRQGLADSGLVMSSPTQIHQIIMNLCTNAVHAMDKDGGVMELDLRKVELNQDTAAALDVIPGTYLRLTVSDTGEGIPPEVLDRIFEPYFTTKEVGQGTGLGLSVVHGIVKNHGGAIVCRSVPNKGTTFEVYLPGIKSEEKAVAPSKKEPLATGTERILFIDDEPALTYLAKEMLSRLGYEVTIKTSSIEAFDFFREKSHEFDLVITDMTMPAMTGDRLAQKVMEIRPDIPVILCSGYNAHISEEKIKEMGIREFIMKPWEMKKLAKTIRKVLDKESG